MKWNVYPIGLAYIYIITLTKFILLSCQDEEGNFAPAMDDVVQHADPKTLSLEGEKRCTAFPISNLKSTLK